MLPGHTGLRGHQGPADVGKRRAHGRIRLQARVAKRRERVWAILRQATDDAEAETAFYATQPDGPAVFGAYLEMQRQLNHAWRGAYTLERQMADAFRSGDDSAVGDTRLEALRQQYPRHNEILAAYQAMNAAFKSNMVGRALSTLDSTWREIWLQDTFEERYVHESFPLVVHEVQRRYSCCDGTPVTDWVVANDPSGWATWQWEARVTAAAIRQCLRTGMRATVLEHFNTRKMLIEPDASFAGCSDAELQAVGDRAVATVDDVATAFAARCRLPVVVKLRSEIDSIYMYWVGGLSPAGHMVGTVTAFFSK